MDRGGISIGDGTFIGPKVNLVTIQYLVHPEKRHITVSKPIKIEKNVWIGIAATIMPGVTVGENAIVTGVPAKEIGEINNK